MRNVFKRLKQYFPKVNDSCIKCLNKNSLKYGVLTALVVYTLSLFSKALSIVTVVSIIIYSGLIVFIKNEDENVETKILSEAAGCNAIECNSIEILRLFLFIYFLFNVALLLILIKS